MESSDEEEFVLENGVLKFLMMDEQPFRCSRSRFEMITRCSRSRFEMIHKVFNATTPWKASDAGPVPRVWWVTEDNVRRLSGCDSNPCHRDPLRASDSAVKSTVGRVARDLKSRPEYVRAFYKSALSFSLSPALLPTL
uniref:Uncharacterized protein n=1 Tax=Timema poppense TaxID=170557 RepID=A0A7R9DIP8_TIMPO|nr:unnamed protein product [Timema poppensis]